MRLPEALQLVREAVDRLPVDDRCFDDLDPQQRRALHEQGCAIQDRLVTVLARLVVDMAEDGADLVDGRGNPRV